MGKILTAGINLTNTGVTHVVNGEKKRFAGTFYPAHRNAAGDLKRARTVMDFHVNSRKKADGEKNSEVIRVVSFASKDNASTGRAILMANSISPGMTVSLPELSLSIYKQQLRDYSNAGKGQIVMNADGAEMTTKVTEYILNGDIEFGNESRRLINFELAAGLRTIEWEQRARATEGYQRHEQILKERRAALWAGGPIFGYCRVLQPFSAAQQNGMEFPVDGPITGWFPGLVDDKTKQQTSASYNVQGAGYKAGTGTGFQAPAGSQAVPVTGGFQAPSAEASSDTGM